MIQYTRQEERWNAASHAAGAALCAAGAAELLAQGWLAGSGWAVAGMALYAAGAVGSYAASAVYHAWPPQRSREREWLRRLDHAAIYWHIAGSYSPVTLVALREAGLWGWGLFAFVWAAAVAGTAVSLRGLREHSYVETACYVVMGLSVVVALGPLTERVGTGAVGWMMAEGVLYVAGAVVYALSHGRRFVHTVFHFFVLGGSVCHLMCLWQVLAQCLPGR